MRVVQPDAFLTLDEKNEVFRIPFKNKVQCLARDFLDAVSRHVADNHAEFFGRDFIDVCPYRFVLYDNFQFFSMTRIFPCDCRMGHKQCVRSKQLLNNFGLAGEQIRFYRNAEWFQYRSPHMVAFVPFVGL